MWKYSVPHKRGWKLPHINIARKNEANLQVLQGEKCKLLFYKTELDKEENYKLCYIICHQNGRHPPLMHTCKMA